MTLEKESYGYLINSKKNVYKWFILKHLIRFIIKGRVNMIPIIK